MAKLLDKGYDRVADFKAQMKSQAQHMERERQSKKHSIPQNSSKYVLLTRQHNKSLI